MMRLAKKLLSSALITITVISLIPQSLASTTTDAPLYPTVAIMSYNLTKGMQPQAVTVASGTIISNTGLVLTNSHVVLDKYDDPLEGFAVCIVTQNEKRPDCIFTATLLSHDKKLDLALLRIDDKSIFQKTVPQLPFLIPSDVQPPQENQEITILGFPGVGGETITRTKGLISGFEEREGIQMIKTDSAINPGNSGGTVLNIQNQFIGVPSAVRSDISGIGLIIPATQVSQWLRNKASSNVQQDATIRKLLERELLRRYETDHNKRYESSLFPFFRMKLHGDWKLTTDNITTAMLTTTIHGKQVVLTTDISTFPFPVNEKITGKWIEQMDKEREQFASYKRTEEPFRASPSQKIEWSSGDYAGVTHMIVQQNTMFTLSYFYPIDIRSESEKSLKTLLDTFEFIGGENNIPMMVQNYAHARPAMNLQTRGNQYINSVIPPARENIVVYIENPNQVDQEFSIAQGRLPDAYLSMSIEKMLENEVKDIYGTVENSSTNVVLDGLPGYSYTFTYEGENFNEPKKKSVITLIYGNQYVEIVYGNTVSGYNEAIEEVEEIIKQFKTEEGPEERERTSYLDPLSQLYKDVQYHPYARQINALVNKGIGKQSGKLFMPDKEITRMEALEAIIQSKIFVEKGRNSSESADNIKKTIPRLKIQENLKPSLRRLLQFSVNQRIVDKAENFRPFEGIEVIEAMKMLSQAYELPVWNPEYAEKLPWFIPYYYKALELDILPPEVKHNTKLNRGEFMYMLYYFTREVGERDDL